MNKNQLLVERSYNLNEDRVNWYSALKRIREYKSVVLADFYDTTSSAGDWNGYLVQRIGNTNYMIHFSQENNWPRYGFTVYTGDLMASWKGEFDRKNAESILSDILEWESMIR